MWLRDNKPSLPPLYDMKTPKITKKELIAIAPTINAVEFEALCEKNGIFVSWLDVSVENYNREYYNVEISEYGLEFIYYNGKLEEIIEL
jgi:hypothetical protein